MSESMGGVAPFQCALSGACANVMTDADHRSGQTFIPLLDAIERHATLEADALDYEAHS